MDNVALKPIQKAYKQPKQVEIQNLNLQVTEVFFFVTSRYWGSGERKERRDSNHEIQNLELYFIFYSIFMNRHKMNEVKVRRTISVLKYIFNYQVRSYLYVNF